jgi:hypothetical protein
MRRRRSIALMLLVAIASACGPGRGVRVEPQGSPADQFGGEPADSGIRIVSAVFMAGQPSSLAAGRSVVWVSYAGRSAAGLQAFSPASGVASPVARFTPFPTVAPIAMATTPGSVWMLDKPLPTATEAVPDARLLRLGAPAQPARSLRSPPFAPDNLQAVAPPYPRDTVLAGANDRALWLVSPADLGHILVRRDAITSRLSRFAIQTKASPGVAVTARRVFVLVRVGRDTVVIQTRDTSGKVIAVSPAVRIRYFEASPLVACGDRIFGWTHGAHLTLFRIDASGASLSYSGNLPPSSGPSSVTALALGAGCRTIWAASGSTNGGALSRLDASSWRVEGQIDTPPIVALLWSKEGLWAADPLHSAVLQVRLQQP